MTRQTFDLLAIGGGTAGLVTAAGGAGLGARVALVERDRLGGECLWNGCVPSKALIAAAHAAQQVRSAARFGIATGAVQVDFAQTLAHVKRAQALIAPHDSPERFRSLGVHVVEGSARLIDARTVEVNGERLSARRVVIATGTSPAIPPIPGLVDVPFHTNETIFDIAALPATLVVIGAGPIGIELGQAFARLGSVVHLVESQADFLAHEDSEIASRLRARLQSEGVNLHLGTRVERVRRDGGRITITLAHSDGRQRELTTDALLIATGRRPNISELGLDAVGVQTDAGGVVADRYLRTTVHGVFAAGDVVSGALKFTHVADHMARAVLRNALFPGRAAVDYRAVPWVTYTDPELARVGLTETQAREQLGAGVGVWRREVGAVDRAITDGAPDGLVKIVTDRNGKVVGGHILAPHAGDMIGVLTLAVKMGLTAAAIGSLIHPYPTIAESVKQAAEQRLKASFTGWRKSLVRWLVRRG